jgi:hypothetical protein
MDLEGRGWGQIGVLSWHFTGQTVENHGKTSVRIVSLGQDSNWTLPKHKSRRWPLNTTLSLKSAQISQSVSKPCTCQNINKGMNSEVQYILHWGQHHHSCHQDRCISVIHIYQALEIHKWLHNDYVWLSYFRSRFHLCTVFTPLHCYSLGYTTPPVSHLMKENSCVFKNIRRSAISVTIIWWKQNIVTF